MECSIHSTKSMPRQVASTMSIRTFPSDSISLVDSISPIVSTTSLFLAYSIMVVLVVQLVHMPIVSSTLFTSTTTSMLSMKHMDLSLSSLISHQLVRLVRMIIPFIGNMVGDLVDDLVQIAAPLD